jgi:fumarate reductase subunit D
MMRSSEPFWWSLFGAGGVVSAFLTPITLVVTGVLLPAGLVTPASLSHLMHHPLARLYLFVLISLSLFHAAHRSRFTLVDLGLRWMRGTGSLLLYAGAIAGSLLAAWLLIRL